MTSLAPTWAPYVDAHMAGTTSRDLAIQAGVSESTMSRWVNGVTIPNPRQAVAFGRAVGDGPLIGLKMAGFLDDADLDSDMGVPRILDVRTFPALVLATELRRRAIIADGGGAWDDLPS